jgi:coatomer protein complex subunit epsilon
MPSQDPDELWSLRNQYYVGAYDAVFEEASSARIEDSDAAGLAERDLFVQLANLGKGEPVEDTGRSAPEFRALAHLSALMQGEGEEEEELSALKRLVEEDAKANARLRMIAGIAFSKFAADPNEALRILHGASGSLEALHLTCAIYLSMDRLDLAKKTLEQMQGVDEDATLTQLSGAWVAIVTGTERSLKDAAYTLEELIGKWQATPMLVGALSCALIHQGKFSEAEKLISSSGVTTADLLVNQIVAAQHEGRRLDEYIGSLKQLAPAHAWFQEMTSQSAAFDQAAQAFGR